MIDQPVSSVPPIPPPLPQAPEPLAFTGTGGEYFKIWIVNLLLSVITLGIYSAWAKVRRLEYFYRHTRLGGAGFDYHGKPLAILKGRIVAALLFAGYYVAGMYSPEAGAVAFLILILVLPALVVRALRFRLHMSSYRGLRFRFAGGTGEAYQVFLGLGLASFVSLFALAPLWHQRMKRYVHSNSFYGATRFAFDAPVSGFYRIYLFVVSLILAVMACVAGVAGGLIGTAALFPGGSSGPDAVRGMAMVLTIMIAAGAYLFGSVAVWALIRTRVQNLVWNHTRLGPHRFRSRLSARWLMFITITNLLGIVFTLGLYKPFAEVRLVKYVTSVFELLPVGSLDDLLAGEQQHIGAAGDEAVDMFDVEIAF